MHEGLEFEWQPVSENLLWSQKETNSAVYCDFDYTLFRSNSTELFIANCKPAIVVAVLDFLVRRCLPWRLTRLHHWFRVRDYACCLALLVLTPWNFRRWRRIAPALFEQYASPGMRKALQAISVDRLSIISFGMAFIIRALLRDSRWHSVPLVATTLRPRSSLLVSGKRAILDDAVGADAVARAAFITDSLDDADLLAAVETGILIEPQGPLFLAAEHLYLPLRYTARAKYTRSYVLDQVVLVEFTLLVISICRSVDELPEVLLAAGSLFLSLMCVYEIGYFENDIKATRLEESPRVTAAVERYRSYPIEPGAWVWASMLAGLGVATMFVSGMIVSKAQAVGALLAWAAAMVTLRLTFRLYNGPDLVRRLYLYPLLQALKFLPILVLMPPTEIGTMAILCQVATMWAIYLTYRLEGRSKDVPKENYRVLLLAIGAVFLCLTDAVHAEGFALQLAALCLWCVARLCKAPVLQTVKPGGRA